jgi:hypothetical protein
MSEQVQREIRAARPAAPEGLRERVRLVAAQEPAREPFLARFGLRRSLLVAVPATLVVALLAAGVIGLTRPGSPDGVAVSGSAGYAQEELKGAELDSAGAPESSDAMRNSAPAPTNGGAVDAATPGAIAPDGGRLQRIDAELSLRVDDVDELSGATQEAMRIVRALGGHVVSSSYDATAGGAGFAQLSLRVPSARVQTAVVQLSGLGTILGQRFGTQDLQQTVDDLARQITETEQRVAQLRRQLAATRPGSDARASLSVQLDEARRQLAELRRQRDATTAEGTFATIQLALTTEDVLATPGAEEGQGALDRVVDILRWEGLAALYVLVVLGPFLVLGLLVWIALRLHRRRTETRLLAEN